MAHGFTLGDSVRVIGGKYKNQEALFVGETDKFFKIRLKNNPDEPVRTKKEFVRGLPEAEVAEVVEALIEDPGVETPVSQPSPSDEAGGSEADFSSLLEEEPEHVMMGAVLQVHQLSIMTWNACKMSFMDPHAVEMRDTLSCLADEVVRRGIEVIILQEVPKLQGRERVRDLHDMLNQALVKANVAEDSFFQEPWFPEKEMDTGRETYAILARSPLSLRAQTSIKYLGEISFTNPPFVVLVHDPRFATPSLRNLVLASVHTPGSSDQKDRMRQRVMEVNALLRKLPSEVERLFSGVQPAPQFAGCPQPRSRGRPPKSSGTDTEVFASPVVLCGDLNVDLNPSRPTCLVRDELREELQAGMRFTSFAGRVEVALPDEEEGMSWVAEAPASRRTCGRSCLDWFLWNRHMHTWINMFVSVVRLTQNATKRHSQPGLSDHHPIVLQLWEDGAL